MPYKDGNKWRAVVKIGGKRAAQKRFETRKEARDWEHEERKRLLAEEEKKTLLDFVQFSEKYLNMAKGQVSKDTHDEKVRVTKRFLKHLGTNLPVKEITPEHIANYLLAQSEERSANAANKDRKELHSMWNWGMAILDLPTNPVAKVKKFRHDPAIPYVPPERDVLKMLAAAEGVDRLFLECYLQTGARRSEIFKLVWDDVNFDKRTITLTTRKTRDGTSKRRTLQLDRNDSLWNLLEWWWKNRVFKEKPHVFVDDHPGPNYGKPYLVRRRFTKSLCERAGIRPFGFHALRHFVASMLADKYKESTPTIQRILGHERLSTTDRYVQRISSDIGEALGKLGNREKAIEESPQEAFIGDSQTGYLEPYPKPCQQKNAAVGERHGRAKLTEEQVRRIRSDTFSSHAELAREYNVSEKAIRLIRQGVNWKPSVPQPVPQK